MTKKVSAILVCLFLLFGTVLADAAPLGNSLDKRKNDETKIWGHLLTGFSLDANEISLIAGNTHGMKVHALFKNKASLNVTEFCTFESSDKEVAVVDENGVITAKGTGTAVVKVTLLGKSIKANVTVNSSDVWSLVWKDEFDGPGLDTKKWTLEDKGDGFGNNEAQYYRPDNASVKDGKLVIQAKKESYGNREYTSAKLFTKGKGDWKYGKFEARIKLPEGQGFWPAFWMMPTYDRYGGWAASGEIDIMEAKGRFPYETSGAIHYGGSWPNNKFTSKSQTFPNVQTITDFHTYAIEWEPGEIRWYVDGKLFQKQDNWNTFGANGEEKYAFPAPFDQEFYLILNLAIGGNFDGGRLPDDSMLPAAMEVDYVRVYELTGRPYKTPVEPGIDVEPLPNGARQPDVHGNLVLDTNFEQGIKDNQDGIDSAFGDVWNYVHNPQFGGAAEVSVDTINSKNYAKIDVTSKGTQPYSVQLEQLTTLGKGRWYRYSFDAKADKNRTLQTKLGGGPTAGWVVYSDSYTVNLTPEFRSYEYIFQMSRNSDILTRIEFNCATDTGPVWIGNVKLEEIASPVIDYNASKDPLPGGNHIYNGAFDKYTIDRMSYWNTTKENAIADISVPENTRELTAIISNGGDTADSITVDQRGLQLLKGNDYKLSFRARASSVRAMHVKMTSKDGTISYLPETAISLTPEMKLFELPFKMTDDIDLESKLVFMLGGNDADVYIDNVTLKKTSIDYTNVTLFPLKNGDFGLGLYGWEPFTQGASANFSVENGDARVSAGSLGTEGWNVMLNQSNMGFSKGIEYELSFNARASVPRDMLVTLENSSYTRRLDTGYINLTNEMQRYSYSFQVPADEILALKFQMGNTPQAAIGDIYIDNVVLQVKNAPVLRPPTVLPDTSNNRLGQQIELAYGDDASWMNAIHSIKVNDVGLSTGQYALEAGKLTIYADAFPIAKSYDILVDATGYAPVSIKQDIMPDDGNVVKNGDMSQGKQNWNIWTGDGAAAAFNTVNDTAQIDISNIGPYNWSIQFIQEGVQIEAGRTYELSLSASSTVNRPIQVEFFGYKGNESVKFDITSDDSVVHKYILSVPQNNSVFDLKFLIGKVINGANTTPTAAHTLYIDDIAIKAITNE